MKPFDLSTMRRLVRQDKTAGGLFQRNKETLKKEKPRRKGNLRDHARQCETQAYRATFKDIQDDQHRELQSRYNALCPRGGRQG